MSFVALALVLFLQGPSRTFTLEFNHDGVNTSSYDVVVDGVRSLITPSCSGVGDTRLCTSPLVLTLNVNHTVSVIAVGDFGEGVSVPFACVVPRAPVNPKVGR